MNEAQHFGLSPEDIKKINSVFSKYNEIQKVIIYGSRALGNYKPASDIDITMMTNQINVSFLFKVENEIDDLLLPYKVDLSIYDLLDNENLKEHINRFGLVFYQR